MVVPIHSVARASEGHMLEGTRLTLVRVPNQPDAYEFSIRTPVTPPRWKDFDLELEVAFEAIVQAFVEGVRREDERAGSYNDCCERLVHGQSMSMYGEYHIT